MSISTILKVLGFVGPLSGFEGWLKTLARVEADRLLPVGVEHPIDTVHVSILGMKFDLILAAKRTA